MLYWSRFRNSVMCLLAAGCCAVLMMIPALPLQAASATEGFTHRWIIELEDPPTLEFTGTELAMQDGRAPGAAFFEATAPAVTSPGQFDPEAPHVLAYARYLADRQADFAAAAERALGRKLRVEGAFRHVANGVVLTLGEAEAERLQALPGVRSVERERLYHLQLANGPGLIGARALNQGGNQLPPAKGEGVIVGIIDSGINWNHRAFSDNPADNAGYVIQNPRGAQLGLCAKANVLCNNKLIGVYDFTNEPSDGLDTDGHGTHVAAIAAANEWRAGQAGVAPRANIVSYRVCVDKDPENPDVGTCQTAAIVQALDQAVQDRVNVANFSIGSGPSNPWNSPTARRVLNLFDAGITFITSAGNSGPNPETVGWPAESPWMMAVGASTTESCAGGRIEVQNLGTRQITYGSGPNLAGPDLINVLVRRGGDFSNNFLGCQPFPAGVFDNAIALVERGECTFATKINNAAAAGARAVLVFNTDANGRICMAGMENTSIPAAMLSRNDGLELNGLIGSGVPQRVSFNRDSLADQVAGFSSRGPSRNVARLMKPNVVAPGAGIQAAYVPGPEEIAGLSGTSMASPHVAGAVALLRQLNPELTPSMATSVLETTAEAAPVTVSGSPASIFDRGAGRIRVDLAARAGLYLGENSARFLAANPATGGDPGSLNLPGLVDENCGSACTFTRTVTAIRNGSWTVTAEGQPGVVVSPASFSLVAGASQTLEITVTPAAGAGTSLQHGAVVLSPANLGAPVPGVVPLVPQRLPIGVRSSTGVVGLPSLFSINASSNAGRRTLGLGFIGALDQASFPTSALVAPTVENFFLPQDPNNNTPYDRSAGTRSFFIDVPEGTLALWAETTASSATDIDLFVGRDNNGDGIADAEEEQCRSVDPAQLERCVISNPQPGRWWVVVQNWQASSAPNDSVRLELAVLSAAEDDSLIAFGPGRHADGPLELDVFWDVPELRLGERMLGVIGISGQADQQPEATVPVVLKRDVPLNPSTTVMFPGETLRVVVPGNGAHDRLVFDVPPTATSISVRVEGESGVSGTLRRVPFAAIRDSAPQSPAPSGPALASGSNSAAGFTLARSAGLEPGRYFVQLQNSGAAERVVEVSLTVQENAAVLPRFGLWDPAGAPGNPREIAQGIEWQQAGAGFALWYSYEPSGLPVFYLGTTALNPNSSIWVTEVNRYTRGADGRQVPTLAGTIGITAISAEEMVFSWRLNGGHGSDIKRNSNSAVCPLVNGQRTSYTGTWFTPGQDQGGSSVVITDNAQGHIRYYYDAQGVGRWVLATDGGGAPLAEELDVLEFRGFCPNCNPEPISVEVVGSYFRSFTSEDSGNERLEFVSGPPLNEVVTLEVPITRLSTRLACP